jgi:hypothetical protein
MRRPTPAPRRSLLAGLCLAAAVLACARAQVPIESGVPSVATVLVIPPTSTQAPVVLASATGELAEATGGATAGLPATATPAPTATPELAFNLVPLTNGSFDNDLGGWNVTPNWTLWQDGYARVNAIQGALLVQFTNVPQGEDVRLHFNARSETVRSGECQFESNEDKRHAFAADGEWHEVEVDFTPSAGTQIAISLQARSNNNCDWLNLDDVYWRVAGGDNVVSAATATPEGATPIAEVPTPEPSATVDVGPTAPAGIPAGAIFTRDLSVTASGDSAVGVPSDLVDGQTVTWASLRNGTGAWVFNLGGVHSVAGLRLTAHRDGDQDTTVRGIDVSTDGLTWTEVYRPGESCGGTANCQVIAQGTPVELAFGPIAGQYVRVRSGPTRFALAEVEVAVTGN